MKMARKSSNHTRAVSAVLMVYGFPGKLLEGWEAEPLGGEEFMLHRANGTSRKLKLNDSITTAFGTCVVSRSDYGTLSIGDYSVIIGRGIKHGFQARAMSKKNTYTLISDKGRTSGQVVLGDTPGNKAVSLHAGHLLRVGDELYPIVPKQRDINLLVFTTPYENGYYAYINVNEIGNANNRKDGFKGVFVPPECESDPALFYDDYDHQKVVTAKFWIEKGDQRATFLFRDAETALLEKQLERKLLIHRQEAIDADIDPEEYVHYCEVKKALEPIRDKWERSSMLVTQGAEFFKPHKPGRMFDSSAGMSR